MKLSDILALSTLSVIVNGTWLAVMQPVILSIGALLTAIDRDLLPNLDIQVPFITREVTGPANSKTEPLKEPTEEELEEEVWGKRDEKLTEGDGIPEYDWETHFPPHTEE